MVRVRELREARGMQQKELAIDLHVTQPTISDWESGKKVPSARSTQKIADYFGVTLDYLLGRDEVSDQERKQLGPSAVRIPVLGSIPAGIPIEAIEDIIDWEEIPTSMCSGSREYFALLVKGDSMWPDYLPGDVVIVRKTPACESGDVCVVYVNGFEATLKQVKLGEDGSLTTVPRNQNYNPRTYSPEEIQSLPVSIAGVVVELRRKIK